MKKNFFFPKDFQKLYLVEEKKIKTSGTTVDMVQYSKYPRKHIKIKSMRHIRFFE